MYSEPELTQPVDLCDARGHLNPQAVGWSRQPLHHCNLKGHALRKKRWNYWCITNPECLFSLTLSDIDYMGLPFVYLLDFASKKFVEKTLMHPFGAGCHLPDDVGQDAVYKGKAMPISFIYEQGSVHITASADDFGGERLEADCRVHLPAGHETLNVVIPWGKDRFQFTSKQHCLPVEGYVKLGDRHYNFDPQNTFACLDFGSGIWRYQSFWNWGGFSQRLADGRTISANMGAGWTDGTGMNENGICLHGRLSKISEDLCFGYDTKNYMAAWQVKTKETDRINLQFTPFFERIAKTDIALIRSEVHQMIGTYTGTLTVDGGEVVTVENAIGWAEDHQARW